MEVKIGVQHAARELVVDTEDDAAAVEKQFTEAVAGDGVLALTDTKGRRVIVPADKHRLRRDRIREHRARRLPFLSQGEHHACMTPRQAPGSSSREGTPMLSAILWALVAGTVLGLLGKAVAPGDQRQPHRHPDRGPDAWQHPGRRRRLARQGARTAP